MPKPDPKLAHVGTHSRQHRLRFGVRLLTPLLVVTFLAGALFAAKPANAQWLTHDQLLYLQQLQAQAQQQSQNIWQRLVNIADKVSKKVGDVAFKNALRVFLGQVAQDTATWVASGGTGQKPLFITDPHYWTNLSNAAAGDYLDSLSKDTFGVSLCDPGLAKINIDIALRVSLNPNWCQQTCQQNHDKGLQSMQVSVFPIPYPTPFTTTLENARAAVTYLLNPPSGASVDPFKCKANGLANDECADVYQKAINAAQQKLDSDLKICNTTCSAKKRTASCTLSQINDNIQNGLNSSSISLNGRTVATAQSLQDAFKNGTLPQIFDPDQNPLGQFLTLSGEAQDAAAKKAQEEKDLISFSSILPLRSIISGSVKTPGSLTTSTAQQGLGTQQASQAQTVQTGSPIADAFGIFTNTLTSKLIQRIFSKGLVDDKGNPVSGLAGNALTGSSVGGVQAARDRFASLTQVNFGSGGGVDVLNDLSSCPTDVTNTTDTSLGITSPNNCVLDAQFRQAIEQHLTVQQAIDQGFLSDSKVFGFDVNNVAGNQLSYLNGYPYRSLVILRKYRVIPVGWELAAQYIRDYEKQNVNIRSIMQAFDNPDSPYYRLIDPSWVLKAPDNICLRTGYTNTVVSDQYVDADGDESLVTSQKNIDYSVRYCNGDSDANVGQVCTCDDGTAQDNTAIQACTSTYDPNDSDTKGRAVGKFGNGQYKCSENTSTKSTCAFITPRQEQVQRTQACVDERTCILEDDNGACKQWGVCTQEQDAWKFNGQSCNAQYASCQTFTNSSGTQVSYLQNTLQSSVCGPDNAGCQQYSTGYDYSKNAWADTATDTIRFNKAVGSCDPTNDGCTQFIRQTIGTNLLPNGSFEQSSIINVAGNAAFDGWKTGDGTQSCGAQSFVGQSAAIGSQTARLQWSADCGGNPAHTFTNTVNTGLPLGSQSFTVSFYAKSEGATCKPVTTLAAGAWTSAIPDLVVTPEWQRFTYSATVAAGEPATSYTLTFQPSQDCTYDLDGVQVEPGSQLTDYKDYGEANIIHLKRPPSEPNNNLGCTGDPAIDPPACANYALKCSAADAGCDLFTPTAGGLSVPAKAGTTCPADKVGCATYREQPTYGQLDKVPERTGLYCKSQMGSPNFKLVSCSTDAECGGTPNDCQPLVSIIGTSGKTCTAQEVGCEAYTNLDEVAQGGEGKAQFTELKLCVPPNYTGPGVLANYYSWVGSDEKGYQLKQFQLIRSNLGSAPCTNLDHTTLACADTATNAVDCSANWGKDPACSQYYDDSGNVSYRLRDRVIEQSASCHPYRNAVDGSTYYADSQQSLSCSAEAVGCRAYVGNTGNNTRTLIRSEFETGTSLPWSISGNLVTTESVTTGGHSLRVGAANNSGVHVTEADTSALITSGNSYLISFWAKSLDTANNVVSVNLDGPPPYSASFGAVTLTTEWNQYTLGPVTYTAGGTNPSKLSISAGVGTFYLDNISFTAITDNAYMLKGSQTACGGFEGCTEYRNRNGQVQNLLNFSKLCQANKVGCEALVNTRNSSTPFSSTVTLSSTRGDVDGDGKVTNADVEYLQAYLTSGGPAPFPFLTGDVTGDSTVSSADLTLLTNHLTDAAKYPLSADPLPGDQLTTPADAVEFWVNDPAKVCSSADKGCRALGRQNFGVKKNNSGQYDLAVQNTDTVYLKDDPDQYQTILCSAQALFCDAFTKPDGSTSYFRDPGSRTCSYQDAANGHTAGWYIDGTSAATPNCPSWMKSGIPPSVPTQGFAGQCPAAQSGCGNFLDPIGTGASTTVNSDLETGSGSVPDSWSTKYCSNNPGKTCQVNTDCGVGQCLTQNQSVLEYSTFDSTKAVRALVTSVGTFRQTVSLNVDTPYVLSAYLAKSNANATEAVKVGVQNCVDALGNSVGVHSPDSSMVSESTGASFTVGASSLDESVLTRFSGRFYAGQAVTCQVYAGAVNGTTGAWVDNLELRQTTSTSVIRSTVDTTSCNGQIGDTLGCHLFNDLSNTSLTYDADTSPVGGKPEDKDATGSPNSCGSSAQCDSNVVLKVTRDRICSKWLAPTTTVDTTDTSGKSVTQSLAIGTCDSFSPTGQCNHFVEEKRCTNNPKQACSTSTDCGPGGTCKPFPVTASTTPDPTKVYTLEDLRSMSGIIAAGLQWSPSKLVTGKYSFGAAPQVGADSAAIQPSAINGDFSATSTFSTSGWQDPTGSAQLITTQKFGTASNNAPVSIDPYVQVTPRLTGNLPVVYTTPGITSGKLAGGRSYMLSFKVKYTQPVDSSTDPTFIAGISSGTDITQAIQLGNAWRGQVKPTSDWQTFVVGPLRLSTTASAAEGNAVGSSHADFNSSTSFVFFTSLSNRLPYALDSVSLLPTLQVNDPTAANPVLTGNASGTTYISRTCRSYPSATSLTCDYTDDTGKIFNGWKGYCLQTDPRDSSTCLEWYPVDILNGETNLFGQVTAAGYQDRTPLFICTQTAGYNSNVKFDLSTTADIPTNPDNARLYNQLYGYRRPVFTNMVDSSYNEDGGSCRFVNVHCSKGGICGCVTGSGGGWIIKNLTIPAVASDQFYDYQIDSISFVLQTGCGSGECPDWPRSSQLTVKPDTSGIWTGSWSFDGGTGANWLTVKANFVNHKLSSYTVSMSDDSANGGGAYFSGYFVLKPYCTKVVQVADSSQNAAWSANISSTSYALPNYAYQLQQTAKPFGTIVPPEVGFSTPSSWDGGALNGTQPVYEQYATSSARSGSAYRCTPSSSSNPACSASQCISGYACSNDQTKPCTDNSQCGGNATCILFAGYCSNAPGTLCATDATCGTGNTCVKNTCSTTLEIAACRNVGGSCAGTQPIYQCKSVDSSRTTRKIGDACSTDADCGGSPLGDCEPVSASTNVGGTYASGVTDTNALWRLNLLFANAYHAWTWSSSGFQYQADDTDTNDAGKVFTTWQSRYLNMVRCGTNATDRSLINDTTRPDLGYCGNLPQVNNVFIGSANSQSTQDVFIHDGENVQLRFNTSVDAQQLPLKNIAIDWDGDPTKNQSQLISWGFAPKADPKDPHVYSHIYRVGSDTGTCYDEQGYDANGNRESTGVWQNPSVRGHAFCIAQPAVQIQDNWEWCNYSSPSGSTDGRCRSFPNTAPQAWAKYPGRVIVIR